MFGILNWLFPEKCVGCSRCGSYLCQKCLNLVQLYDSPLCCGCGKIIPYIGVHFACQEKGFLDGLVAVGKYEGMLQKLIKQIKYGGHFDMVPTATQLMLGKLPPQLRSDLVITSVPLHSTRKRQRGFNQSELLAKELANKLKLPYQSLLIKLKATSSQAELKRERRLTNLRGAFKARTNCPGRVLLVDDVTTTRTTLNECGRTLKRVGAKTVFGLVLAHGK